MFNMFTVILMISIFLLCMILPALAEAFAERK